MNRSYSPFILIVPLLSLLSAGLIGCGRDIPQVAGAYFLIETECPGVFADEIEITQNRAGDVITFEPRGLSGSLDSNGDFNISNAGTVCTGFFTEDTLTADCTTTSAESCMIIYEQ